MAARGTKRKGQDELTSEQRQLLNQRRLVVFFHLFFVIMAAGCCLFPWYRVFYGELTVAVIDGFGRPEGKLFMAGCLFAFFFASFNMLADEESDLPVLAGSLLALAAVGWFLWRVWRNEQMFDEIAATEAMKKTLALQTGPSKQLGLGFRPALVGAAVGALNMVLSSLYLAFGHPSLAAD